MSRIYYAVIGIVAVIAAAFGIYRFKTPQERRQENWNRIKNLFGKTAGGVKNYIGSLFSKRDVVTA